MGTSSPVFGFRPIRSPFWRTEKLPNEEIFNVSPLTSSLSLILARIRKVRVLIHSLEGLLLGKLLRQDAPAL